MTAAVLGSTKGLGNRPLVPNPERPAHKLSTLLEYLPLSFADIDPAGEYKDRWNEPVPPWGKLARKVAMSKDDGKRLWYRLRKRGNPAAIDLQDVTGDPRGVLGNQR
jgi:hypothetical protein